MKKMSIEWHMDCYKNSLAYEDELMRKLHILQKEIRELSERNFSYLCQIKLAQKKYITAFDSDKFGKKRGAKT